MDYENRLDLLEARNDLLDLISAYAHGFDHQDATALRSIWREDAVLDLGFFGHATAETTPDLCALIASADTFAGPGILIPTRNSALFRWCLANGLRVTQPMTLMSLGLYNAPAGAFLPSILF